MNTKSETKFAMLHNLNKMSKKELIALEKRIANKICSLSRCDREDKKHPYNQEYAMLMDFLQKKFKRVVVHLKDLNSIVRHKRKITVSDIVVTGVSLICGNGDIEIEYI